MTAIGPPTRHLTRNGGWSAHHPLQQLAPAALNAGFCAPDSGHSSLLGQAAGLDRGRVKTILRVLWAQDRFKQHSADASNIRRDHVLDSIVAC